MGIVLTTTEQRTAKGGPVCLHRANAPFKDQEAMQTNDPTPQDSIAKKTIRAATEDMTLDYDGDDFIVNDDYTVFVGLGCECEDFRWRQPAGGCKHMRRVRMAIGADRIPTNDELPGDKTVHETVYEQYDRYGPEDDTTERSTPIPDGGVAIETTVEDLARAYVLEIDDSTDEDGAEEIEYDTVDLRLFLHGIACETTGTVEDLLDFDRNGEPWSQCVWFAHAALEGAVASEVDF